MGKGTSCALTGDSHSHRAEQCYYSLPLARAQYATELADAEPASVPAALDAIALREGITWTSTSPVTAGAEARARVFVARDTRPSSAHLAGLVLAGAAAAGAATVDYGVLSTPQLHWIVRETNGRTARLGVGAADAVESDYYAAMAAAYAEVLGSVPARAAERGPLELDCAQGVGGPQSRKLASALSQLVVIAPRNTGETPADAALLNEGCGAEHCQKARLPPSGFAPDADAGKRCASLDGDADRLVYWYYTPSHVWKLLDGDKIAALAALFVSEQLAALGWPVTGEPAHAAHGDAAGAAHAATSRQGGGGVQAVSVGVVQTAYANGAARDYIEKTLHLPVPLARTGVKFVHTEATKYDVGVYFEANGHGTVLLHEEFLARLERAGSAELTAPGAAEARARLLAASRLINQAIGDALSDALFVEAVLTLKRWSVQDWDALYVDLPSRQCKLAVADRTAVATIDDETRLTAPVKLQKEIDALVAATPRGRAFVRYVVRVCHRGRSCCCCVRPQCSPSPFSAALLARRTSCACTQKPRRKMQPTNSHTKSRSLPTSAPVASDHAQARLRDAVARKPDRHLPRCYTIGVGSQLYRFGAGGS